MKILIEAYLDLNIGDDLMIQLLAREFKNHELYIDCRDDVLFKPFEQISNIKKTSLSSKRAKRFKEMSEFDAVIKVGGSIYNVNSNRVTIKWLLNLPGYLYLKIKKVKLIVIGCNTGPFINSLGKLVTSWELKLMDLVTVRDLESFNFLKEIKIKRKFCFPDIVFSYDYNKGDELPNALGISAYRSVGKKILNNRSYKTLAKIADEYIKDTSKNVYLLAFDAETENDLAAAIHIKSYMEFPGKATVIGYNGDINEIIDAMKKCEKIIAIRFHSAILALVMKIPFIPIIYSNKMENLLNDLQINNEKFYLDSLDQNSVSIIYEAVKVNNSAANIEEYGDYKHHHFLAAKYYIEKNKAGLEKLAKQTDKFVMK